MLKKERYILTQFMVVLLALTIGSCQENIVHRYCAVDSQNWQPQYKARFHIDDLKLKSRYQLFAEVRLDRTYPFRELWLVVESKANGVVLSNDTVCIDAVEMDNEMTSNASKIHEYSAEVKSFHLTPNDTLDLCVRHIMTHRHVPGVHDVGIKLEPVSRAR